MLARTIDYDGVHGPAEVRGRSCPGNYRENRGIFEVGNQQEWKFLENFGNPLFPTILPTKVAENMDFLEFPVIFQKFLLSLISYLKGIYRQRRLVAHGRQRYFQPKRNVEDYWSVLRQVF